MYIPLLKKNENNSTNYLIKLKNLLSPVIAKITVFLFVLVWHGIVSNYICWVTLSAFELFIEQIGKLIVKKTNIKVVFFIFFVNNYKKNLDKNE